MRDELLVELLALTDRLRAETKRTGRLMDQPMPPPVHDALESLQVAALRATIEILRVKHGVTR